MQKNKLGAIALLTMTLGLAGAAHAEGLYLGGALSRVEYKEDGAPTFTPTAAALTAGYQFMPQFAAEARLGTGLASSSKTYSGVNVEIEVTDYIGLYGKAMLPLSPEVSLYGLVGYTQGKLKASLLGRSFSDTDSSLSYGFGAEFSIGKSVGLGLEWASLVRGDGFDLNAVSFTAKYKF
jgi:opacity protein-like surface antigen